MWCGCALLHGFTDTATATGFEACDRGRPAEAEDGSHEGRELRMGSHRSCMSFGDLRPASPPRIYYHFWWRTHQASGTQVRALPQAPTRNKQQTSLPRSAPTSPRRRCLAHSPAAGTLRCPPRAAGLFRLSGQKAKPTSPPTSCPHVSWRSAATAPSCSHRRL